MSRMAKVFRQRFIKMQTPGDWEGLAEVIRQSQAITQKEKDVLLADCAEQKWRVIACAKSEADWLALLGTIPDDQLRAKAASIVWWDYGSQFKALWPVVLSYNFRLQDDSEALYGILRDFGYPEGKARKRCAMPKTQYMPNPRPSRPATVQKELHAYVGMDKADEPL